MAAPALKPCPVCRGTGGFLGRGFAVCDCGMVIERASRAKAAADWNRLSALAAARTNAAVREALAEACMAVDGGYPAGPRGLLDEKYHKGLRHGTEAAVAHIRAQVARLDAAPSAQPEGGADADR